MNTPRAMMLLRLFGLVGRYDLLNVVQRELPLSQVLLAAHAGLSVLPAARAVKKLGRLSLPQQQTLLDAMSGLERPVDVILVDASMAHPNGFSPFGLASQEAVVVLSATARRSPKPMR
jgi:flagellar biosynthesis protein FlhG